MDTSPPLPLPLPAPDRSRLTLLGLLLLAACCLLPWLLAWSTPLYPPDEGRHASMSMAMAERGSWSLPTSPGAIDVSTPPLTAWLQAASILVAGPTEWAVRVPGLLAASGTILVLFAFARTLLGTRPALIAAALASVMPFHVIAARMATADSLLALAWLTMLTSGFLVIAPRERRRSSRALAIFWIACGTGLLAAGPAALGPLAILVVWASLASRPSALLRLQPLLLLPLAAAPYAAWVIVVLARHSDAAEVGARGLSQSVGDGAETGSFGWLLAPAILLVGLFPATTMLVLPGINCSARAAGRTLWTLLRSADVRALAIVALLLPLALLLLFPLPGSGTWMSFLPPLAPPLALLAAITLERWLEGTFDEPIRGLRPPDVRITYAIVIGLAFLSGSVVSVLLSEDAPHLWLMWLPVGIAPMGALVAAGLWSRGGSERRTGLAAAWVGLAAAWSVLFGLERRYIGPMGADGMVARLRTLFGSEQPAIVTAEFDDPCIAFYNGGRPTTHLASIAELAALSESQEDLFVLLPANRSAELLRMPPEVTRSLMPIGRWTRWPGQPVHVYFRASDSPRHAGAR